MQIAGVPNRTPPDQGEMNYPYLFDLVDRSGYQGWLGCEFRPGKNTPAGLAWLKQYGLG
jgi:hydroxypyruvate isomerase